MKINSIITRLRNTFLVVGALALGNEMTAEAAERPNIILIMADDLGVECLGTYGSLDYKTPVLDKMAKTGVKFDHCFSTPLCTPSRVQLMSGRYNHRNYIGFGSYPVNEVTFGKLLQDAGYTTCIVGKWQLGGNFKTPNELGFSEYCLQNAIRPEVPFDPKTRGKERYWGYPVIVANGKLYESTKRYGPDMINEYALDFVHRCKDKPFFLYYPMILTHDPFAPTPLSVDGDKSGEKISEVKYYRDMVEYADHLVGRLLRTLEEEGIRENTIVIFTGDNGTTYPIKVTQPAPANLPVVHGIKGARHRSELAEGTPMVEVEGFEGPITRTDHGDVPGGKDLMSERGTHVPLIVDWPGYKQNYDKIGHRNDGLVDFTDFLPTLVELAGGKRPENHHTDGHSLVEAFKGESASTMREWTFCHYWYFGRNKDRARDAIQNKRWKLYGDGRFYDLNADLEETSPLKTENLDSEAKLALQQLQEALNKVKEPVQNSSPGRSDTDDSKPGGIQKNGTK